MLFTKMNTLSSVGICSAVQKEFTDEIYAFGLLPRLKVAGRLINSFMNNALESRDEVASWLTACALVEAVAMSPNKQCNAMGACGYNILVQNITFVPTYSFISC